MPRVVARVSSPQFVGRDAELHALRAAFGQLREPGGRVVLVAGEAGIGKTRFLREADAGLESDPPTGRPVLRLVGTCIELTGGAIPYGPIIEILEQLAGGAPSDLRRDLLRLLDELSGAEAMEASAGWAPTGSSRGQRFQRVRDLLAGTAVDRDVAVIIDDLHWADQSTLDLLRFLANGFRDEAVLLVLAYRSDELHRRHPLHPWLAALERSAVVERLELGGLDDADIEAQVAAILGEAIDPAVVGRVVASAEGNPFHAEELLASGGEASSLSRSLQESLLARVEALGSPTSEVLQAASVIGREWDESLLVAISGLDAATIRAGMRGAIDRFIVEPARDGNRYRFRHALLREAVYRDLLPGDRIDAHRQVARALLEHPEARAPGAAAAAAERAHHLAAGHQHADALDAFVVAAKTAERAGAWAESAVAYERALELRASQDQNDAAGASEDLTLLLEAAARVVFLTGRPRRALELVLQGLKVVDPEADPSRAGELMGRVAYYADELGERRTALDYAERAYALVPAGPTASRAWATAMLGRARMQEDRLQESLALATEALEAARALGSRELEVRCLSYRSIDLAILGFEQEAIEDVAAARIAGDGLEHNPDALSLLFVNGAATHYYLGRYAETFRIASDGLLIGRRLGVDASWDPWLIPLAATACLSLGDWGKVDSLLLRGTEHHLGEVALPRYIRVQVETELAAVRGDRHAPARAAQAAAEAGDAYAEAVAELHGAAALGFLWHGLPEKALEQVDRGLARQTGTEAYVTRSKIAAIGIRACADIAERRRAQGKGVLPEIVERAERWFALVEAIATGRIAKGAVGGPLPRLALACSRPEYDRALGRLDPVGWDEAITLSADMGLPLSVAYSRYRSANAHLAAGDRETATTNLRTAAAIADQLGAAALSHTIRALARRARIPIGEVAVPIDASAAAENDAAATARYAWGLSEREFEVLVLVAGGRTNRQIGEALFITESTASVHVTHILDKLGVSSRVEAALLAGRAEIVPENEVVDDS